MQQEAARMQQQGHQQGQQQSRSSVPPLARLAALLASTGARSDGLPASAVLDAQQQKQLQHELQQLLMQQLAAAQREGRAVAAAKDAASEAVEREETLAELHRRLRDTASSSLLSRLAALLLSKEQQPLQRPQAILQVLLHLSSAAEQQRNQTRRHAAAAPAVRHSPRRPPAHAAAAAAASPPAEQEAATSASKDRAGVTSAARRLGESEGAEAAPDNLALSLSQSRPPAVRRLHPPAAQPAHAPPGLPYDLWGLDELSLLRDLLFALQGIEGRFVRYDPRLQTFCLSPTVHASPSVQGLVARVGSLGALYLRVQAAVENHSASLLETRSLTAEAFHQSVREQIRQYFKLLAVLEEDLLRSEEAATQGTAGAAGASSGPGGTATLRRLAVWLQEPYQRMRLLASLTEATKGLQGGALLSTIHAHCALGEAELRAVALDILQQSLQPLADSIEAWTRYGQLRDDAGEFFVREAPQDLQLSSWCSRFVLVPHQIPSFMPPQLPERLLLAGKSLLYSQLLEKPFTPEDSQPSHRKDQLRELPLTLQELLTTEEQQLLLQSPLQQQQQLLLVMPHSQQQADERGTWLQHEQQQAFNPQQQHEQQNTSRLSHDPELPLLQKIEERVSAAAATGNQRLVALLLWDHQLLSHLEAIRRFVLLGDGDFTSMLLDAAMQQPQQQQQHAGSMSLQPLILSAIDTAARQCSSGATLFAACPALAFALTARFPHTSYLQQQHQQPQPGSNSSSSSSATCSSLWRGLVLHLRIDGPLKFFIGEGLIKRCHKLFAALWKAHLTHRQLQAACLRGNSLQKQLRQQQRAAAAAAAAAERKAAAASAGRNLVSRATAAAREELLILHVSQICHLLNEMLHFSRQWLHFAHQEVVSPNWRLFYRSIPRCRDLDEFISLLWRCLEQQHDGLFLYDAQEAVAAASGSSKSSSVQLHALLEQMQETCSSMASRAEFRFAAAAEQQLLAPSEERAAGAQATSSSSSSSSMLAVEEQRQAFRRQMLQLLQLLESKQSEVRAAAAAAQAISGSGSSSRSRMHLDHCMAIRSLRTRLDYNDFYEHQRQMLAVTTVPSGDTTTSRFPSLLLQQQHAVAASSSSSRSNSRFDKRADGYAATAHPGSNASNDDASTTGAGAPIFLSKLQQQLQQQLHQQMADEATRPPTACEASAPPSPLVPQGLRDTATAASANRLLGRI